MPHKEPHVAAWHIQWLEEGEALLQFQKELVNWLKLRDKEFLSHVTVARNPFVIHEWKKAFQKLPLYAKNIYLCESLGNSKYKILWEHPLLAPFDEMEHTADIAFRVRGDLYLHAQLALAFHFPPLVRYFDFTPINRLDDIVMALNATIARVDSEMGCPFKAVSFHGTQTESKEWEMIVDV